MMTFSTIPTLQAGWLTKNVLLAQIDRNFKNRDSSRLFTSREKGPSKHPIYFQRMREQYTKTKSEAYSCGLAASTMKFHNNLILYSASQFSPKMKSA